MKKLFILILTLSLTATLLACGNVLDPHIKPTPEAVETTDLTVTDSSAPDRSTSHSTQTLKNYDEGVYLETAGENLVKSTYLYEAYGEDYDVAAQFINLWMNSDSHREAMLSPKYKTISISVTIENGAYVGVRHFFG